MLLIECEVWRIYRGLMWNRLHGSGSENEVRSRDDIGFLDIRKEDIGRFLLIFLAFLGIVIEANVLSFTPADSLLETLTFQLLVFFAGLYSFYCLHLVRLHTTHKVKMEKKLKYLDMLHSVTIKVEEETSFKNQLKIICEGLADILNAPRVSIMLQRCDYLEIIESVGLPEDVVQKSRVKIDEGIAGWVYQNAKPLILNGPAPAQLYKNFVVKKNHIASAMSLPLKAESRVIGVLNISHYRAVNQFDEDDLQIVTVFASEVAVALQKACLIEQLSDQMDKLKETQFHLMQSEKIGGMGVLVSGLAHELKNFMCPIKGYVEFIESDPTDINRIHRSAKIISATLQQMSSLIEGILNFSRKKENHLEELNLNDLIQETLLLFEIRLKGTSIYIERILPPELPPVMGNSGQIKQVIFNLLNNAYQAYGKKEGLIYIYTRNENEKVILSVRDKGKGIPEELQEKLFEPFFTTKGSAGTGLGLSICKMIMEGHQGEIRLSSKPGDGTLVELIFPNSKMFHVEHSDKVA